VNVDARRPLAVCVQISYLILLVLYSYFMMVELRARQPTITEHVVWFWAATLWIEEIRQVRWDVVDFYTLRDIALDMTSKRVRGKKSRFRQISHSVLIVSSAPTPHDNCR